jgi:hypothetical protein
MGVDVGGPALEVAIGLAFVFFLLSTLVSAITEGLAWVTKQRAKQLERGLTGLLGDNKVARKIFNHALVQSDARTPETLQMKRRLPWEKKKQRPSYVSARNFSLALIDTLATRGETSDDRLEAVKSGAKDLGRDDHHGDGGEALEAQLAALLGDSAVTELRHFRDAAEEWFDDAMDRVSGWYKRWSQRVTCVLALAVAIGLNASAIVIAERLADEPTVRAAVVSRAETAARKETGGAKAAGRKAEKAANELKALELPLLWPHGLFSGVDGATVVGWLITAIAISLGAPFWFDALGKLARLRTTGKKPKPEPEPEPLVVVNPPVLGAPESEAPA